MVGNLGFAYFAIVGIVGLICLVISSSASSSLRSLKYDYIIYDLKNTHLKSMIFQNIIKIF